jgi:hypoxanthine phosphoribosyltransferase
LRFHKKIFNQQSRGGGKQQDKPQKKQKKMASSSPSKKSKPSPSSSSSVLDLGEDCPDSWKSHIGEVIYSEQTLQDRVRSLAGEISDSYKKELSDPNEDIVVVGLLNGAICFVVDLVRHLKVPYTMDFMALSSYRGSQSKGTVELKKDLSFDPCGKHILIVEDIVDTGNTLKWLRNYLKSKQCASIKVACLLDKKEGRKVENVEVVVDYVGFICPNKFVVGYGLDYEQRYRGLPFIGVLKPEVYTADEEH